MWIMLATKPVTFINALLNTDILLSVNIFSEAHGDKNPLNEGQFGVLEKWRGKFDCLAYEMLLFITELNPSLNTQSDSISAKLLV